MKNTTSFQNEFCHGDITLDVSTGIVVIYGTIKNFETVNEVQFIAASPMERRMSYMGSGLPFANAKQAFDNTPNVGTVEVKNNQFLITISLPNSYYVNLGAVLVPPTLYMTYVSARAGTEKVISLKVSESIPYRTLTYPYSRINNLFYEQDYNNIRSQESILRASEYPKNIEHPIKSFWNSKPPC